MQQAVLVASSANGAEYIGADCIVPGPRDEYVLQTQGCDRGSCAALHPADGLLLQVVNRFLGAEMMSVAGLARIPVAGLLSVPRVPVIMTIAMNSRACQLRCLAYVEAQLRLIERGVEAALLRKYLAERAFTRQLREGASYAGKAAPDIAKHYAHKRGGCRRR
jgi:hypothetical protein